MKNIYTVYLFFLVLAMASFNCNKNTEEETLPQELPQDNIEDCEVDEFYTRFLSNGKCWVNTREKVTIRDGYFRMEFRKSGAITENLIFRLPIEKLDFNRNKVYSIGEVGNWSENVTALYTFTEGGDGLIIGYSPALQTNSTNDYLEITHINADTTIVEGKFHCTLLPGNSTSIFNAPDSLKLTEGQFKIQLER